MLRSFVVLSSLCVVIAIAIAASSPFAHARQANTGSAPDARRTTRFSPESGFSIEIAASPSVGMPGELAPGGILKPRYRDTIRLATGTVYLWALERVESKDRLALALDEASAWVATVGGSTAKLGKRVDVSPLVAEVTGTIESSARTYAYRARAFDGPTTTWLVIALTDDSAAARGEAARIIESARLDPVEQERKSTGVLGGASSPSAGEHTAPSITRTSADVMAGVALWRPNPEFPQMAKTAGVEGKVTVEVMVSQTGRVLGARVISGHPLLRPAALAAAQQWSFEPTMLDGVAVNVVGNISFTFAKN